ncbi:MAG: hypothetical protein GX175_11125 [Halanaerobiaceae bacterium]|jgi:hypothetical protein|nr:hypothetical protein [Halanaerobiaceae bacterium]
MKLSGIIHHGTFIIGLSIARHNTAVAPEDAAITEFEKRLRKRDILFWGRNVFGGSFLFILMEVKYAYGY